MNRKKIKEIINLSLFVYSIFLIFVSPPIIEEKKREELFYKIDNSFTEQKIMKELASFIEPIKKPSKSTKEWIYKLTSILFSFKNHFTTVTIIKKNDYDAVITSRKGEIFFFKNGKMLPPEELPNEDNFSPYFYYYPIGKLKTKKKENIKFPKPAHHALLNSLYGVYAYEIEYSLEIFRVLNRKLRFHQSHNAAKSLINVLNKIEELSKIDKDIKRWISETKSIYTYSNRSLRNSNSTSLHSYGIALDIMPYDRSKHIYWLWAKEYRDDWWNIKDNEKISVPEKVIELFEKNGFIWGGKWYFFDIMHFEYRPEIIKYMTLLKEDPLEKKY